MANRTQVSGRLASLPAPIVTAVTPGYNGPNVPISYEQANGFQEAVCRPLEDHGVTLDKDNYDQTAEMLSGVHAITSEIRSNLATTGTSTVSKKSASAVTDAICSGTHSQCNAGDHQSSTAYATQCNGGSYQESNGQYSQCNAGAIQKANGNYTQCNAGQYQTIDGADSQCNAGHHQYNSGNRAVVSCGSYVENIEHDCLVLGKGTSTPPSGTYGDGLTNKNRNIILHADTGNAEFSGEVTATGGLSTVAPAKFVAAYDLTDMRWEVTIDAIGGIIEIPFDSSFPLDGAILKMTNSKFGSGSRMYCQPVAPPTLTQTHGFVVNVNTDGEMYFHDAAAAIEETVQVWFDIINPV